MSGSAHAIALVSIVGTPRATQPARTIDGS